jgi:hypothetical protein
MPHGREIISFDAFNISEKLRAGKLTQAELNNAILAHHLRFESLDDRAEAQHLQ